MNSIWFQHSEDEWSDIEVVGQCIVEKYFQNTLMEWTDNDSMKKKEHTYNHVQFIKS